MMTTTCIFSIQVPRFDHRAPIFPQVFTVMTVIYFNLIKIRITIKTASLAAAFHMFAFILLDQYQLFSHVYLKSKV